MTMIGTYDSPGMYGGEKASPAVVEINGEQYAKLPEGWPAADAKDLEEAHAEAVANDEKLFEWEQELYTFTPEEVKALAHAYIDAEKEVTALRKGMKTMQRKTRKQNQVQRRLERRLAQARAARDRAQERASFYAKASLRRALAELEESRAKQLRLKEDS